MNNKECVITRCYESKSGEFILSLKFKIDELTLLEKETLKAAWRDSDPQEASVKPFQEVVFNPDQTV